MTKLEKAVDEIIENDVAYYTVLSTIIISILFLGWNVLFEITL